MDRSPAKPCYFTCVLSEALEYNKSLFTLNTCETAHGLKCEHEDFGNVSDFVSFLAKNHGKDLAVGCITPSDVAKSNNTAYTEELLSALNPYSHKFQLCESGV